MRPGHSAIRLCDACGRELDLDQVRFCTDMCRETFQSVYGGGQDNSYLFSDDEVIEPSELEDSLNEFNPGQRSSGANVPLLGTESGSTSRIERTRKGAFELRTSETSAFRSDDDDESDEDDLDDDFEDDDLDDEDDDEEEDDDDDLDFDDDEQDEDDDPAERPGRPFDEQTPPQPVVTPNLIRWEGDTAMEAFVGIVVVRATCSAERSYDGSLNINIIAELRRRPDQPAAGGDRYLRLTAVAEDEFGEFLGWGMTNISRWDQFPPLVIESFSVQARGWPARFRLYPEVTSSLG